MASTNLDAVTVSVSPDERKTYLKPTGDASPCYLGINTYL